MCSWEPLEALEAPGGPALILSGYLEAADPKIFSTLELLTEALCTQNLEPCEYTNP